MGQRAQRVHIVSVQPPPATSPKLLDRVRGHPHKRHPAEMGESEINQFLTHLAVAENVAASTQNQALSGILFLYQVT